MQKNRILLLGVNGFLGSTIFEFAKKTGHFDVIGASRNAINQSKCVSLDVTKKDEVRNVINELKPNIIIWSLMDRDNEMMLIENGLKNLLQSMQKETKLIYLSTDAFFYEGKGDYKESDKLDPAILKSNVISDYAKAKLRGEFFIKENHQNHIIIRTGPLYGRDGNGKIEKRTEKIINLLNSKKAQICAAANLVKSLTNVQDIAEAIVELCLKDYQGTIHLGPTKKESYYTFYKKRLQSLGIDCERLIPVIDVKTYALDTSLNTQYAHSILQTKFRIL